MRRAHASLKGKVTRNILRVCFIYANVCVCVCRAVYYDYYGSWCNPIASDGVPSLGLFALKVHNPPQSILIRGSIKWLHTRYHQHNFLSTLSSTANHTHWSPPNVTYSPLRPWAASHATIHHSSPLISIDNLLMDFSVHVHPGHPESMPIRCPQLRLFTGSACAISAQNWLDFELWRWRIIFQFCPINGSAGGTVRIVIECSKWLKVDRVDCEWLGIIIWPHPDSIEKMWKRTGRIALRINIHFVWLANATIRNRSGTHDRCNDDHRSVSNWPPHCGAIYWFYPRQQAHTLAVVWICQSAARVLA